VARYDRLLAELGLIIDGRSSAPKRK